MFQYVLRVVHTFTLFKIYTYIQIQQPRMTKNNLLLSFHSPATL